jgi:radical SAM protein with 4Fe4S-binding SPASM domain
MVSWSRSEAFGAWVRLDDATLVAVDPSLAERLGVAHGFPTGVVTRPLELHVAVTTRCPAPCTGCYLDARPDGAAPAREELFARLAEARAAGVSTVAFGGGEPLTRDDLGELAREARRLGLVPVMTTSGIGLDEARARSLVDFAQIHVSHDGVGGAYVRVRGFDGAHHAERAIRLLAEAGLAVGVNLVLTRDALDALEPTAARVAELGARELQLLRYKPAGRAADPTYDARRLTSEQVAGLFDRVEALARRGDLRVRIDCAMVALLSEGLLARVADPAATLAALGVFGCEAGRHLGGLDVHGRASPCSFLPAEAAAATFAEAWDDDAATLGSLRAYHAAPSAPCDACPLRAVCRGGCQAVSRHLLGRLGPDPECPRVLAHLGAKS